MAKTLTQEDFRPLIGKRFSVIGRADQLDLVAVEARAVSPDDPRPPFSLLFRGPRNLLLPEGLHRITADGAGFELYIIPIQTPPGVHQDYQCVFN